MAPVTGAIAEEIGMQKLVAEILAAWRRSERLEQSLEEGSLTREAARRASERLRDLYHDLLNSGVVAPLTEEEARELLADAADDVVSSEGDLEDTG